MNHSSSIFEIDSTLPDWLKYQYESSFSAPVFCTESNINDCMQYLSQELCSLGYPSTLSDSSSTTCPYSVNCDIVQLINVTHSLVGRIKNQELQRENYDDRLNRIVPEISYLKKRNSTLNDNLEQLENKYRGALERERQLKERNNQLSQSLKCEKDESRKLSCKIQQQRNSYQHEIRKTENEMNKMKSRMTHVLSEKNPVKKVGIANATKSQPLKRTSSERSKWQTGSVAKTATEEMFNSVISNYESQCNSMVKELSELRQVYTDIELKLLELIPHLKEESLRSSNSLNATFLASSSSKNLTDRFNFLLNELIKTGNRKSTGSHCALDKGSLTKKENVGDTHCCEDISKEKVEIANTLELIEKEKSALAAQRLEFMKLVLSTPVPHVPGAPQSLSTIAAFAVATTKECIAVPDAVQLKKCLDTPDEDMNHLPPLWSLNLEEPKPSTPAPTPASTNTPKSPPNLPNWAFSRSNMQTVEVVSNTPEKSFLGHSAIGPVSFDDSLNPCAAGKNGL